MAQASQPQQLGPAPIRTPMFDSFGNMTRAWQIYFQQLFVTGVQVTSTIESISEILTTTASEDRNPIDFAPQIQDALLLRLRSRGEITGELSRTRRAFRLRREILLR